MNNLEQSILNTKTLSDSYSILASSVLSLANNVLALKDAHVVNNVSLGGYTFIEGYNPRGVGEILATRGNIESIDDDKLDYIYFPGPYSNMQKLKYVRLKNLRSTIEDIGQIFYNDIELQEIHIPEINIMSRWTFYALYNCNKLIDFEFGKNITSNVNINGWEPSEALKSDVTTLLTQADLDAGFTSNLQKLLYNIREHIAANLPDRTGQTALTITFSTNVKNAINADTATAQAFTSKNWTIA